MADAPRLGMETEDAQAVHEHVCSAKEAQHPKEKQCLMQEAENKKGGQDSLMISVQFRDQGQLRFIPLEVSPQSAISAIKSRICVITEFKVEHQRLSYGRHVLQDDGSLSDYGVLHDSTVLLVLDPCKGHCSSWPIERYRH